MEIKIISKSRLKKLFDLEQEFILIDVLPYEFFKQKHIQGAFNACVYEVDFLDKVKKIVLDKKEMIIVYSSSTKSQASKVAAEKLLKAGYKRVFDFKGGIKDWEKSGYPIEVEKKDVKEMSDIKFSIDRSKSFVEWTGRNLFKKHYGIIEDWKGVIELENRELVYAKFELNMNSIVNHDLKDEKQNKSLISHLKSVDFFDVKRYPEVVFELREVKRKKGVKNSVPNFVVIGDLIIKDITHQIRFDINLTFTSDMKITIHGHFDIDRTLWEVKYGSERFFEKLGMHLVDDIISIDFFIVGR